MRFLIFVLLAVVSSSAFAGPLEIEKQASGEYVELMKAEQGAYVIEEGIVLRPIYESSTGVKPASNSIVVTLYDGIDRHGKIFDSAYEREIPATFPLEAVISCWQLALPKMSVGSVFKVTCLSDTAYGDQGRLPTIKPGAALTFRVSLLEVQ